MKRIFAFLCLFSGSGLFAISTPTGTDGLLNVVSAIPDKAGRFNFVWGVKGSQIVSWDTISLYTISADESTSSDTAQKGSCWIGDIPFAIGISITDYIELNVNSVFMVDVMNDTAYSLNSARGSGVASYGLGDLELGVKFAPTKVPAWFSPELSKKFNVGIYPAFSFPTGREKERIPAMCQVANEKMLGIDGRYVDGGIHRFFTAGGVTYGGKLLITDNLSNSPPVLLHLNIGYTKYPCSESKYSYGLGFEARYQFFAPFVELYSWSRGNLDPISIDHSTYDDGGMYITPGLRFETAGGNVWLTLAVDLRIVGSNEASWDFDSSLTNKPQDNWNNSYTLDGFGATPPWRVNLTFSQGFDFIKPPAPKTGTIAGKVMDAEDAKGIRAIVSFPAFDTTVTTDENGSYTIEVPIGNAIVSASAVEKGDYKPSPEQTVLVEGGQKYIINFRLARKEKVKQAILMGTIVDKITKKSCLATVSFPESSIPPVQSDTLGIYKTELVPGTYVVRAEKSGYVPWTQPITCEAGQTTILNIELNSASQIATIAGKVIDYKTRQGIGGAVISFPNTQVPDVQAEATTGTYKADIPAGTYTVKVSAEGYIPEGIVIIAEAGKSLLKDFELFKKEEKIVLQGITFEFNSDVIRPSSYPVLDDAVKLLREHSTVKVEIAGHTDWVGSDAYNLNLSQRRAESVRVYLISHGIDAGRLIAQGYGEGQPVADNRTEAGRSQNRRIEFRPLAQ